MEEGPNVSSSLVIIPPRKYDDLDDISNGKERVGIRWSSDLSSNSFSRSFNYIRDNIISPKANSFILGRSSSLSCGYNEQCNNNQVVQQGITCQLQVFLTSEGKGWGVRTLERLRKGSFVCQYVGEVLTNTEFKERHQHHTGEEKHTYSVLLDGGWGLEDVFDDEEVLWLDATYNGNVARFINHRCFDSNMVGIPVKVESQDHSYYHLAFFTTREVDAGEELTRDYGIDFNGYNDHVEAFRCQCRSKCCRDVRRSQDVSDYDYGTTNIISIFGGVIYIGVDSRITNKEKIKTDYYRKIRRYTHNVLGTTCGSRKVSERLQDYLTKSIEMGDKVNFTVEKVADLAANWLKKETEQTKEKRGTEPATTGKRPPLDTDEYQDWKSQNSEWISWEKKNIIYQQCAATFSFIFGFQSKIPKVFVVNGTYDLAADISMDYTLHQYINGIKGSMAGSVSQSSPPHHHVLGSCRPVMREYIGKSEYFKRIKDECHNAGILRENSFGVERDVLMDFKEYAKAITYAAISDICTGGQIIVGRMSRGGIDYHEINVAEVYLQNFDELEDAPVILFAIQAEQMHQWMVESLQKYLKNKKCLQVPYCLGVYNDFWFFRLVFKTELERDKLLDTIIDKRDIGEFGLPVVYDNVDDISWTVCGSSEEVQQFL